MSIYRTIAVLAAGLSLAGCSTISARHDFDPAYGFQALNSYDWLPIPASTGASPLAVKRFKAAFDAGLAAKSYRLVSDNADFLIAVHAGTERKVGITDWGYRGRPYWGTRDISIDTWVEGRIVVDFIDRRSKEMFWRGVAEGRADAPKVYPHF